MSELQKKVWKYLGIPYKDMNCFELVKEWHSLTIDLPSNDSPKANLEYIKQIQHRFTQITSDMLVTGDLVLHGTHVGIYIKDNNEQGIIHSTEPYSEFVHISDKSKGLNNGYAIYEKPTFWRINEN